MDVEFWVHKLVNDYGYTLTKDEVAQVLSISVTTVDRKRKYLPTLFPPSKKIGTGIRARVVFPVLGIAQYLAQTQQ